MPSFYGTELASRLMLGTAQYPSPAILAEAFRASGAGVATVSLRRESGGSRAGEDFWTIVRDLGVRVLPNTAGCHSVKEAVTTAHMAREVFGTPLDQARGDRPHRHAAARPLRASSRRRASSPTTASRSSPTPPRTWSSPSACSTPAARC